MSASSLNTRLNSAIFAHAAFLVVAGMLALQGGCDGPVSASPAATETTAKTATPAAHFSAESRINAGRYLVEIGAPPRCRRQ